MGKIQFYKIGEKKVTILQVCNTKFASKVKKIWKKQPPISLSSGTVSLVTTIE